jgi:hypothetical protein
MTDFSSILQSTLTPIALISGVGLLLLSMVNRYNHAIDRIRQLLDRKRANQAAEQKKLEESIRVIYARCRMMRNAILCVGVSIVSSGSIVFATALEGLTGLDLLILKELLLVLAVGLIVVAAILFVIEVTYSLHALRLEME